MKQHKMKNYLNVITWANNYNQLINNNYFEM